MYRVGVEAILGLQRRGDTLVVDPCIPPAWTGFTLTFRFGKTVYQIRVENPERVSKGVVRVTVDGQEIVEKQIPLKGDGATHEVVVKLGNKRV